MDHLSEANVKTPTAREKNKFAVVTGASTGIGFELALLLSADGYDLLLGQRHDPEAEKRLQLEKNVARVVTTQVDLSMREGSEKLFEAILEQKRPVDVLVLNAGTAVYGEFGKTPDKLESELALLTLNISSVVHLAKRVVPMMVARGQGKVLITSSLAALLPGPFYATYAASKAFLLSFSEALSNELKESGVTVTTLMPSPTDTPIFKNTGIKSSLVSHLPKADAGEVAKQGFDAMMLGKDHVVPGLFGKFAALGSRFLSERTKAWLHRQMLRPLK